MGPGQDIVSWTIETCLNLGRVSNLPTVWTNTLAGVVLAGSLPDDWRIVLLLLAMSLAYTGGMFLNDAFDRVIDALERPERPIPSGKISSTRVFLAGYTMLATAVILVSICALASGGGGIRAIIAALALCAAIVLYNTWHKDNPFSPFIMGLCRMLVYITAGWTVSTEVSGGLYIGAIALLCYLIGLTYTAKQENFGEVKKLWPLAFLVVPVAYAVSYASTYIIAWLVIVLCLGWIGYSLNFVKRRRAGDIPKAVVSMIAGICLVDAMFLAAYGSVLWVAVSLLAFCLTLYLQRYIAGT